MKNILKTSLSFLLALLIALPAQAADRITYYHNDALGSPVAATSQTGQLLWRETYRPYGERLTKATASTNNHSWFTGKQEESALGINYFGARWYHPEVGRFLSGDPAGTTTGNIHSFNRYAYANNNPYLYVDPNGKWVVPAVVVIGVAVILATNNAQAPTTSGDLHPNMDTKTVDAVTAAAGLVGLANAIRARVVGEAAEGAARGVGELTKAAGGTTRSSGDVVVDGGRSRAKELFREFDVKGVGERTIVSDKTGGGKGVVGEMGDGTPLRIRMKPDGTTRLQAGDQKFIFPK